MAAVYTAKGGRSEPDAGTFPPKNTQAGVKRGVAPLLTNAKMIKVEESSEDENTSLAEQIPTRVRSETATMDAIPAIAIKEESIEDDEYVQIKLVDVEESSEERTENNESDRDNESIDEWSVKGEDDKIIGGYECPRHSQPWQVYLTYDDGNRWCGASMINERWAVSAAHCYVPAHRLALHLGEHNLLVEEGTEQRIWAEKVIPHPGYDTYNHDHDFMLIKLRQPAVFNQYVQPIPLATSCATAGDRCLVSGWGNMINTGVNYATDLQCLDLPILSDSECRGSYGSLITDNMFCAGFLEGGKDSCQGDSGGPVVCNGELQGVVSWGYGCAESGYPGVYAKVCRYSDWVQETIASN